MPIAAALAALLEARAAAGVTEPVRPGDAAEVDRLIATLAPLRLPAELEELWRSVDVSSLRLEEHLPLDAPERALEAWLSDQEEAHEEYDPSPSTLLQVAYASWAFRAIELSHEGVVGGAIFQSALDAGKFVLRFASLTEWLEQLTRELRAGRFEAHGGGLYLPVSDADFDQGVGLTGHPRLPPTIARVRADGEWPPSWETATTAYRRRASPSISDRWEVALSTPGKSVVRVGESLLVTASAVPEVTGTGFELVILDEGTGERLAVCTAGGACTVTLSPPYSANSSVGQHDLRAEVRHTTTGEVAVHARLTVVERRWINPVALRVVADGDGGHVAVADADVPVTGTGYTIRILQDDRDPVGGVGAGTRCTVNGLARGHRYRAVVEDAAGWAVSSSMSWTLPPTGPPKNHAAGRIDLLAAADLFTSAAEVRDRLERAPWGQNGSGWEIDVQRRVCDALLAQDPDASALEALEAIAATDGGHILVQSLVVLEPDPRGPVKIWLAMADPGGPGGGTGNRDTRVRRPI